MTILAIFLCVALCGSVLYIIYLVRLAAGDRKNDAEAITGLRESLSAASARETALKERLEESRGSLAESEKEITRLRALLQQATGNMERLQERISLMERENERITLENEQRFKVLAQEILEANTGKFNEQSKQSLDALLSPLKTDIDRFKQQVESAYNNEARERFALSERIKELVELNMNIGREAKDLARALRGDSKVQGDWGEMVLEKMLEASGLVKGIHFDIQVTTDADGNALRDASNRLIRPDAVVHYPDGRCVVVDSKVSLTRYVDLVNADPGSQEAKMALDDHVRSVRSHINELAAKNYQDFIGAKKADFVMMFIPNEGAYIAAMQAENKLWQEAYDKRVLIVSPTHLISVLKLVEQMWRQDDMKKNVLDIADVSGKMYDKFVGFLDDMGKIEKALTQAGSAFNDAYGKLMTGKGNLVGRAEKLRQMGAKVTKRINSSMTDRALTDGDED